MSRKNLIIAVLLPYCRPFYCQNWPSEAKFSRCELLSRSAIRRPSPYLGYCPLPPNCNGALTTKINTEFRMFWIQPYQFDCLRSHFDISREAKQKCCFWTLYFFANSFWTKEGGEMIYTSVFLSSIPIEICPFWPRKINLKTWPEVRSNALTWWITEVGHVAYQLLRHGKTNSMTPTHDGSKFILSRFASQTFSWHVMTSGVIWSGVTS